MLVLASDTAKSRHGHDVQVAQMRRAGISFELVCVLNVLLALRGAGAIVMFILVPPWSSVLMVLVVLVASGFAWLAVHAHANHKQRDDHQDDDEQGIRLGLG
jgi:hypothetical protein